jgi:hypothetical protein
MRAEQAGIEANISDPFGDKVRVLPCCHGLARLTPTAEQEVARLFALSANVVIN